MGEKEYKQSNLWEYENTHLSLFKLIIMPYFNMCYYGV